MTQREIVRECVNMPLRDMVRECINNMTQREIVRVCEHDTERYGGRMY